MRTDIVLTLTGPDRLGIVEEATRVLLELGGNVETSRMARLGGEFAIVMLLALPEDRVGEIESAFSELVSQGYKLTTSRTEHAVERRGWLPYRIEVSGADHEGIVHEIARGLSERGIQIESADTSTSPGAFGGAPLFSMSALVVVPPDLPDDWLAEVAKAAGEANVDVSIQRADAV